MKSSMTSKFPCLFCFLCLLYTETRFLLPLFFRWSNSEWCLFCCCVYAKSFFLELTNVNSFLFSSWRKSQLCYFSMNFSFSTFFYGELDRNFSYPCWRVGVDVELINFCEKVSKNSVGGTQKAAFLQTHTHNSHYTANERLEKKY
jgi:hypothetical protein